MTTQEQQMFIVFRDTIASQARQLEHANKKISELMKLVSQQGEQLAKQTQQIKVLLQKIDELASGPKDSYNSSKPPSSYGYAKKPAPKSLRQPGGKNRVASQTIRAAARR